jgi:hypothetical protein
VGKSALRLVGGANVPTRNGLRINLLWPSAVLEVTETKLLMQMRSPILHDLAKRLDVTPGGVIVVFPVRGILLRGVGVTTLEDHDFFFWTHKRELVLDVLSAHNYPVDREVRRPRKAWRGRP